MWTDLCSTRRFYHFLWFLFLYTGFLIIPSSALLGQSGEFVIDSLELETRNHPASVLQKATSGKPIYGLAPGQGEREVIIGKSLWRMGRFDEAYQAFMSALDVAQHNQDSLLEHESWRGLATVSWRHGDFDQALDYQLRSFAVLPSNTNPIRQSRSFLWMGTIHADLRMYKEAIRYYQSGIELSLGKNDVLSLGELWNMVGRAYRKQKVYDSARYAHDISRQYFLQAKDSLGLSDYLNNVGSIFRRERRYDSAIIYFNDALEIQKRMNDLEGLADGYNDLGTTYSQLGNPEMAFEYLQLGLEVAKSTGLKDDIRYAYASLAANYDSIGDYRKALRFYRLEASLADSLFLDEVTRRTDLLKMVTENERQELEINEFKKAEEEQKTHDKKRNQITLLVLGLGLALVAFLYWRSTTRRNQAKELAYKNRQINREKQRSDQLLLNILPESIAEEMMAYGKAQPKELEHVTVMFTDFVGFSKYSAGRKPREIVHDLQVCFEAFDRIIGKHNLEKIKTIGDAYMCAGGLPEPRDAHEIDVVKAGLEIQEFMEGWIASQKRIGEPYFKARVGIHSGPVVAGVVGLVKYTYDIWGNTVNVASRMESSGEPGRVNISEDTYKMVRPYFICRQRGKIKAKNMGEVKMYFADWAVG